MSDDLEVTLQVRVPKSLAQKLREIAEEEGRTLSGLVRHRLQQTIALDIFHRMPSSPINRPRPRS